MIHLQILRSFIIHTDAGDRHFWRGPAIAASLVPCGQFMTIVSINGSEYYILNDDFAILL